MEETNNEKICEFIKVAREIMTCSLCRSYVKSNIYQCSNGHLVCSKCVTRDGKTRCLNCMSRIMTKRCIILDNFAEILFETEKLQTIESLEQLLECIVCYNRITPDFKLCDIGHAICRNCCNQMMVCPICNNNFSYITNKVLAYLINMFPYRCNYFDKGCTVIACHQEILRHEIMCQYREFYCQVRKCFWKGGTENNLLSHLTHMHPKTIRASNSVKLTMNIIKIQHNMVECRTQFVTFNGRHFWQHFYCMNGRIQFVTVMLGSPDEAKEYKVVVSGNSLTETFDAFSDENVDINTNLKKQHLITHNITNLITQKLIKTKSGELAVVYECQITIQKAKVNKSFANMVSLAVFGGFVLYLLLKGNK